MIGELGRNALIVLAEMADPANSRFDSEKGMRWAKHVIAHRRDLIMVLLDIMAVTRANDAVEVERARLAKERAESRPSSAGGTGSGNGNLGVVTAGGENHGAQEGSRGGSVHGAGAKDGLVGIPEDEESTYAEPPTYATLADVSEVADLASDQARPMGGFTLAAAAPEGASQPAVFAYPERPSSVASGPPSLVESVGDDYDFDEERREREEIIGDGGPGGGLGGFAGQGDGASSDRGDDPNDAVNNGSRVGGVEQTHSGEQFALTPDCAHIAAAAVFGIISWDPCMDKLLSVLEGGDTRRDGVAVLVSRVVALLADALPRRRQKRALYREKKEMDGEGEQGRGWGGWGGGAIMRMGRTVTDKAQPRARRGCRSPSAVSPPPAPVEGQPPRAHSPAR